MKKSLIKKIILQSNVLLSSHTIPFVFSIGQSNAGSLFLREHLGATPIFASSLSPTQTRFLLRKT